MGLACTQQLHIGLNSLAEHPTLLLVIWVHLGVCYITFPQKHMIIKLQFILDGSNINPDVLKHPPLQDGYLEVIC